MGCFGPSQGKQLRKARAAEGLVAAEELAKGQAARILKQEEQQQRDAEALLALTTREAQGVLQLQETTKRHTAQVAGLQADLTEAARRAACQHSEALEREAQASAKAQADATAASDHASELQARLTKAIRMEAVQAEAVVQDACKQAEAADRQATKLAEMARKVSELQAKLAEASRREGVHLAETVAREAAHTEACVKLRKRVVGVEQQLAKSERHGQRLVEQLRRRDEALRMCDRILTMATQPEVKVELGGARPELGGAWPEPGRAGPTWALPPPVPNVQTPRLSGAIRQPPPMAARDGGAGERAEAVAVEGAQLSRAAALDEMRRSLPALRAALNEPVEELPEECDGSQPTSPLPCTTTFHPEPPAPGALSEREVVAADANLTSLSLLASGRGATTPRSKFISCTLTAATPRVTPTALPASVSTVHTLVKHTPGGSAVVPLSVSSLLASIPTTSSLVAHASNPTAIPTHLANIPTGPSFVGDAGTRTPTVRSVFVVSIPTSISTLSNPPLVASTPTLTPLLANTPYAAPADSKASSMGSCAGAITTTRMGAAGQDLVAAGQNPVAAGRNPMAAGRNLVPCPMKRNSVDGMLVGAAHGESSSSSSVVSAGGAGGVEEERASGHNITESAPDSNSNTSHHSSAFGSAADIEAGAPLRSYNTGRSRTSEGEVSAAKRHASNNAVGRGDEAGVGIGSGGVRGVAQEARQWPWACGPLGTLADRQQGPEGQHGAVGAHVQQGDSSAGEEQGEQGAPLRVGPYGRGTLSLGSQVGEQYSGASRASLTSRASRASTATSSAGSNEFAGQRELRAGRSEGVRAEDYRGRIEGRVSGSGSCAGGNYQGGYSSGESNGASSADEGAGRGGARRRRQEEVDGSSDGSGVSSGEGPGHAMCNPLWQGRRATGNSGVMGASGEGRAGMTPAAKVVPLLLATVLPATLLPSSHPSAGRAGKWAGQAPEIQLGPGMVHVVRI